MMQKTPQTSSRLKGGLLGTSLAVQRLRLHASTARTMCSLPGRGTKIPRAMQCGQKIIIIKNNK